MGVDPNHSQTREEPEGKLVLTDLEAAGEAAGGDSNQDLQGTKTMPFQAATCLSKVQGD